MVNLVKCCSKKHKKEETAYFKVNCLDDNETSFNIEKVVCKKCLKKENE